MQIKREKMNIEIKEDKIIEKKRVNMKVIKISLIPKCFRKKEKPDTIIKEKPRSQTNDE